MKYWVKSHFNWAMLMNETFDVFLVVIRWLGVYQTTASYLLTTVNELESMRWPQWCSICYSMDQINMDAASKSILIHFIKFACITNRGGLTSWLDGKMVKINTERQESRRVDSNKTNICFLDRIKKATPTLSLYLDFDCHPTYMATLYCSYKQNGFNPIESSFVNFTEGGGSWVWSLQRNVNGFNVHLLTMQSIDIDWYTFAY